MTEAAYRAVAILKAKAGEEARLLDLTRELLPAIGQVDGLDRVEANVAVGDPGRLVLYYWWRSPEQSRRYVAGPLYMSFAPRLEAMVDAHEVFMLEHVA